MCCRGLRPWQANSRGTGNAFEQAAIAEGFGQMHQRHLRERRVQQQPEHRPKQGLERAGDDGRTAAEQKSGKDCAQVDPDLILFKPLSVHAGTVTDPPMNGNKIDWHTIVRRCRWRIATHQR